MSSLTTTAAPTMTIPAADILRRTAETNPDSLLLVAFGSRAYGAPRPDSDLDILHVVSGNCIRNDTLIHKLTQVITASCGAPRLDVITKTEDYVIRRCNLYGHPIHDALRRGTMLYSRQDCHLRLAECLADVDPRKQSAIWLSIIGEDIRETEEYFDRYGDREYGFALFSYNEIEMLLRAWLLHERVRFPYGHNIHALYDLLPAQSRRQIPAGWDANRIQKHIERRHTGDDFTLEDATYGMQMAVKIYKIVSEAITQ